MDDVSTEPDTLEISGETARLARELAELTGEDVVTAVRNALGARVKREREIRAKFERIMALADQICEGIKGPVSSANHNELYGKDGLPA
ncbi:MAG: type II toxin-antitoxin system VapB family antitoxin [Acetobacteraceae bacterium]|nr:type II toxin-antitoxin system VapB family antitoxin [Acetobacteraceae bacterium]